MIPLSDEIWKSLGTAYGEDATEVADALRDARDTAGCNPAGLEHLIFTRVWNHVCHQGTPYPALFATIPHLIDLASMLAPSMAARANILGALGFAIVNAELNVKSIGNIGDLDPLRFDCRDALRRAAILTVESILCDHTENATSHLFATLAARKGDSSLYFAMWELFDKIDPHKVPTAERSNG